MKADKADSDTKFVSPSLFARAGAGAGSSDEGSMCNLIIPVLMRMSLEGNNLVYSGSLDHDECDLRENKFISDVAKGLSFEDFSILRKLVEISPLEKGLFYQELLLVASQKEYPYLGKGSVEGGKLLTYVKFGELGERRVRVPVVCKQDRTFYKSREGIELYCTKSGEIILGSTLEDLQKLYTREYVKKITIDYFDHKIKELFLKNPGFPKATLAIINEVDKVMSQSLRGYLLEDHSLYKSLPPVEHGKLKKGFKLLLGNRLLRLASIHNQPAVAQYAVEKCNAKPDIRNHSRQTPLMLAATHSRADSHLGIVEYLLKVSNLKSAQLRSNIQTIVTANNFSTKHRNSFAPMIMLALERSREREKAAIHSKFLKPHPVQIIKYEAHLKRLVASRQKVSNGASAAAVFSTSDQSPAEGAGPQRSTFVKRLQITRMPGTSLKFAADLMLRRSASQVLRVAGF